MPSRSCLVYQIWASVASSPSARNGVPSWKLSGPTNRLTSPLARPAMNSSSIVADSSISAGPSIHPTALVSGLLMSAQSGPSHCHVASKLSSIDGLRDLEVRRSPVEVGDAEAGIGGFVAGTLVVVGDRPHVLARLDGLAGAHDRLGGVETGEDHVRPAGEELVGHLGRIERQSGDVEPEADPLDLELELRRVLATERLPAVAGTEERRVDEAAGLVVDQRPEVGDAPGLRGQRGGAAGDHLAVLHAPHDVAEVGEVRLVRLALRPGAVAR